MKTMLAVAGLALVLLVPTSATAKPDKSERDAGARNAAQECKAERAADLEAFRAEYGTNRNGRNAFGKCVSGKTRGGS
jgi:hypothetical protein